MAPADATSRPSLEVGAAEPQLFVSDITASCDFFRDRFGFATEWIWGDPPYYAQVSRGKARLNLRLVCEPVFVGDIREREELLAASIVVEDAEALFREFGRAGADFRQTMQEKPWGARDFIVRDLDGNLLLFAGRVS